MILKSEKEVAELQKRYLGPAQRYMRESLNDSPGQIFDILRYHLGWQDKAGRDMPTDQGKGLRPILCLTACELCGGNWQQALPAASALEFIHNFSLIHDDIQDGDVTRRGRETVWSIWGVPIGLTAGNVMRVVADQTLLSLQDTGIAPKLVLAAAAELTRCYMDMIAGQYMDMAFEKTDSVSVENYLDMIGRKTGALIEGAMYMGALIATENVATARAFGRCGRLLGLAFQARDDYLGIWGKADETGKPVGSDIKRRKKSLPVVYLLNEIDPVRRLWLDKIYASDAISDPEVEQVIQLMEEIQTRDYVNLICEEKANQAIESVLPLIENPDFQSRIGSMADFFITRVK